MCIVCCYLLPAHCLLFILWYKQCTWSNAANMHENARTKWNINVCIKCTSMYMMNGSTCEKHLDINRTY